MVGIVADRFAGLASTGAAVFIPSLILFVSKTYTKSKSGLLAISLMGAYLVYAFVVVFGRNQEWETEEKLFTADVLKEPQSTTLNALLGKELLYQIPSTKSPERRKYLARKAEQHLLQSSKIAKDKIVLAELGNLAFRAKLNYKQAINYYNQALSIDSTYAEPYYHLGWLELQREQKISC